jgi:hypothetical protein
MPIAAPPEEQMSNIYYHELKSFEIVILHGVDIPSYGSDTFWAVEELESTVDDQKPGDRYFALQESLSLTNEERNLCAGKLLGHPSEVQSDLLSDVALMALGREVHYKRESLDEFDRDHDKFKFYRGPNPEEYWNLMREQLAWYLEHQDEFQAERNQWRLLWQIESNFRVDFCIWDAGTMNIFIKDSHLQQRDFSSVIAIVETS